MRIVHIIPGTGGSFYCENCVRDGDLVNALRSMGHDVILVPMYLPLSVDGDLVDEKGPIFFGAINTYLKEKIPLLRRLPAWIGKLLDARPLLNLAAARAGSTRASGLEEMTYSMLRGEQGHQAKELDHLVTWLKDNIKPDVIYLANALLIGLARELKNKVGAPVVCALEDEDIWVDDMEPEWQKKIWGIIDNRAQEVDAFISVSDYYRSRIQSHLTVPDDRIHTIHVGVDLTGYQPVKPKSKPSVIGYLSRLTFPMGLDVLVDAFIILKGDPEFSDLQLRITGGGTDDDQQFIDGVKQVIDDAGFAIDVDFVTRFDRSSRLDFLHSLDLLAVPTRKKESYGLFQVEAMAAGVPTVLPREGAFPEITKLTGGGVTYAPNNAATLAEELRSLLLDPERINELGSRGQANVFESLSNVRMAENLLNVYRQVTGKD